MRPQFLLFSVKLGVDRFEPEQTALLPVRQSSGLGGDFNKIFPALCEGILPLHSDSGVTLKVDGCVQMKSNLKHNACHEIVTRREEEVQRNAIFYQIFSLLKARKCRALKSMALLRSLIKTLCFVDSNVCDGSKLIIEIQRVIEIMTFGHPTSWTEKKQLPTQKNRSFESRPYETNNKTYET